MLSFLIVSVMGIYKKMTMTNDEIIIVKMVTTSREMKEKNWDTLRASMDILKTGLGIKFISN